METITNTNNNNIETPPTVSKLTSTGFRVDQRADPHTLEVGDRRFTITGIRMKDFGDDKFRDVSLSPAMIEKIQQMLQGRDSELQDLTEFTITLEESYGISPGELQAGQKAHYFFDPRRLNETPTHAQLFASGKLKCQLCYNKNGQEIKKIFIKPNNNAAAKEAAMFTLALKIHAHQPEDEENIDPNPRSEKKTKNEQKKPSYTVEEPPEDNNIKDSKREDLSKK